MNKSYSYLYYKLFNIQCGNAASILGKMLLAAGLIQIIYRPEDDDLQVDDSIVQKYYFYYFSVGTYLVYANV